MPQQPYTDELQYGTRRIAFAVEPADRKTLGIQVCPNGRVSIRAPRGAGPDAVRAKVRERARWILKQQRHFAAFVYPMPAKEYVSGETHHYLGRQYRLKLLPVGPREEESVKLIGPYFRIRTQSKKDAPHVKGQLYVWYRAHAEKKFSKRMQVACETMRPYGIEPPAWHIRRMKKRWGSYTPSGRIFLNLELIRAPTLCIDYVILHELCHAKHAHHGTAFYRLLSKVMPRWEAAKERLRRVLF